MSTFTQRNRARLVPLLLVLVFSLTLIAAGSLPATVQTRDGGPMTVTGIDFLGEVTFPTGFSFAGTEVGGLSSITYDPGRQVYYAISDDRSQINPARFYTLAIDLGDGQLNAGDITFLDVTTLLDTDGMPFAPLSLDPEGIVFLRSGYLFVSSEGQASPFAPVDPFVYGYNLAGQNPRPLVVPAKFLPDAAGTQGVRNNLAFESLTVPPDERSLYTATEGALAQDGPAADLNQESFARILQYHLKSRRPPQEYVYVVDPVAEAPDPPGAFRVNGLVELLPIDNAGTLLAMERSFSVGKGNTVLLYESHVRGATDVSGVDDLYDEATGTPAAFVPLGKRHLLNFGPDLGVIPDNLEGLTFGPVMPDGRFPLVVVSDNNFNPGQVTQFIVLALTLEPAR